MEPSEVVVQLWSRIQARDWVGVGELLADDFVLEWPHDLVRIRGRANFVEFNRRYPEGWSIEVLRVVAEGSSVVSEVRVPHPTVGPYYALSFFEVDEDRITSTREYWVGGGLRGTSRGTRSLVRDRCSGDWRGTLSKQNSYGRASPAELSRRRDGDELTYSESSAWLSGVR